MADHPLFQKLTLRGFLSFGPDPVTLDLEPLNVLIGPNGAGKSNVLEAFRLLQAASNDAAFPLREGGGVSEWLWREPDGRAAEAVIEVTVNGGGHFRLAFGEESQRFHVSDDRIGNARAQRDSIRPETSQKKGSEMLGRIRIYREGCFGRNAAPRRPQRADLPDDFLLEDASNLGRVLYRLRREEAWSRLVSELGNLYADVNDVDVGIEGGTVQVGLREGRRRIPATRLSDGTLRYLCLLAVLCDPRPAPFVAIEGPELGLHPDVLPSLADLLVDASGRTQLLVTTHSDILVDALTETPEFVVACEASEGTTELRRLRSDELKPWLKRYRLGELWARGDFGGARW